MGDNFLVSGLIVKYVSVNYIKTFQFKMFYHVISTVEMLNGSIPDDDPCLGIVMHKSILLNLEFLPIFISSPLNLTLKIPKIASKFFLVPSSARKS